MAGPLTTLLETQLRRWLSARGFWLVLAAALVPVILTGAWVGTHQADVAVTNVSWSPAHPVAGDNVTLTATITNVGGTPVSAFKSVIDVGQVRTFGGRTSLYAVANGTVNVSHLDPQGTATVTVTWTAQPGGWGVLGRADTGNAIGEKEEVNNQLYRPLLVRVPAPDASKAPRNPGNLTGSPTANATVDLAVTNLGFGTGTVHPGDALNVSVVVTNTGNATAPNSTITLQLVARYGSQFIPLNQTRQTKSLAPGGSTTVSAAWAAPLQPGAYYVEATVNASGTVHDTDGTNNFANQTVLVQPTPPPNAPTPPKEVTLKAFYFTILRFLELPLLIPLIALFYAGGVIADEQRDGTLAYLLTRPLPRAFIPITKYLAGLAVATVAIEVGIVGTFFLIFGSTAGVGWTFLSAPMIVAFLALVVYGALFTLLAVLVDRPYLIGLGFVLGWEVVVGNFVPWVQNLTVSYHLLNLLGAWWDGSNLVFRTLPQGTNGTNALLVLVGGGIAFLVAAALVMRRREFNDL